MITVAQCVFDLSRAGAQQVVAHLAALRDRSRFRVRVYAFHDGPLFSDLRMAEAPVRIVPQGLSYFDPRLAFRLGRRFREDGVDVVHTHLFGADLHAGIAGRMLAGLPVVSTIHCERHDNRRQRLIAGPLLGRFQKVVAIAQKVADYLTSSWPALAPKVAITPNRVRDPGGVTALREGGRALLGLGEADEVIGTVGRLTEQKAPLDLLEAFAIVARRTPAARLVFIGEGPLRPSLEEARARCGVGDRVRIAGSLPDAARLIPAFDVFALPSRWEGLPMVRLEAMMAGVACVATDVGAVAEVLRDRETGCLLPPGRPELLADTLVRLLADANERDALGQAARRHATLRHSASSMVAAYEDLYQTLHRTAS